LSQKLGIEKENVDFVENYSHESNTRKIVIDYYAMTTLGRILSECERFVCADKKKSLC